MAASIVACRDRGEGVVGRGEDRDVLGRVQRVAKAGSGDRGDQRREDRVVRSGGRDRIGRPCPRSCLRRSAGTAEQAAPKAPAPSWRGGRRGRHRRRPCSRGPCRGRRRGGWRRAVAPPAGGAGGEDHSGHARGPRRFGSYLRSSIVLFSLFRHPPDHPVGHGNWVRARADASESAESGDRHDDGMPSGGAVGERLLPGFGLGGAVRVGGSNFEPMPAGRGRPTGGSTGARCRSCRRSDSRAAFQGPSSTRTSTASMPRCCAHATPPTVTFPAGTVASGLGASMRDIVLIRRLLGPAALDPVRVIRAERASARGRRATWWPRRSRRGRARASARDSR